MNLEYYTRRSNAIVELDLPYEYGISSMKRNGRYYPQQRYRIYIDFYSDTKT